MLKKKKKLTFLFLHNLICQFEYFHLFKKKYSKILIVKINLNNKY